MGKINYVRVILGGIAGGIIAFLLDLFGNGILLIHQWLEANKLLNKADASAASYILCLFVVWIIAGILMVWVYAAIRPRLGAGPRTAVCAGLIPWVFGVLLVNMLNTAGGLYGPQLMFYSTLYEIVPMVACAVIGAWLYKED